MASATILRNAAGCGTCGRRAQLPMQRPIAAHRMCTRKSKPALACSAAEDQAAIQAPEPSSVPEQQPMEAPVVTETPESVFYESSGSPVELAISLMLGLTLIYAPLTLASIGRHLWIKVRFTNKRVTIINTSPLFKNEVSVAYSKIKEIRTVQRGFGLWGDMVIFLKDGARLELTGLEKCADVKRYVESCLYD